MRLHCQYCGHELEGIYNHRKRTCELCKKRRANEYHFQYGRAYKKQELPSVKEWFAQTPLGKKLAARREIEAEDAWFEREKLLEKLPHKVHMDGIDR